jgi:catechol 2,3-dioxygenase-like lactoylglutathione lyase family enzyme
MGQRHETAPGKAVEEVRMKLAHVALVCRSEDAAARFFGELLGLKAASTKTVPAVLSRQLFGIDAELNVSNYVGETIHFELFFLDDPEQAPGRVAHVCLEVADLGALLGRARAMNVTVLRVPKGEDWVTFLEDDDGNRFEIKQAQV